MTLGDLETQISYSAVARGVIVTSRSKHIDNSAVPRGFS